MHTYTHTVNKENFDQASSLSLLFFPSNPLRWKQGNISTDGCLIFSSTRAIRSLLELKKKTRERGREVTAQASASKRTDEIQTRDNFLTLLLADRPANRLLSLSPHSLASPLVDWQFRVLNFYPGSPGCAATPSFLNYPRD